jgi:hypothetical protein
MIESSKKMIEKEEEEEEEKLPEDYQEKLEQSQILDQSVEKLDLDGDTDVDLRVKEKKGKIMTDENEEKIQISFITYKKWFGRYYGISFFIVSQLTMFFFTFSRITSDYVIGYWAHNTNGDQFSRFWFYTGWSFTLSFLISFAVYCRSAAC